MKVLLILAALLFLVQNTSAAQMSGFAARYYQDDGTTSEEPTEVPLYPTITIGKKTVQMEVTHLADISSTPVNKDSSARWVAFMTTMARITGSFLITKSGVHLTALFIAKDGIHKECAKTTEPVRVSVANVPLLNATHGNLVHIVRLKNKIKRKRCFFIRRRQYRMDSSRVIRSLIT
jgi:hypothetical protein